MIGNNELKGRMYYSKILLFGEYSILLEGDALAVPWKKKYAYWKQGAFDYSRKLTDFYFYLLQQRVQSIDKDAFYESIQSGWHFESNIPMGYGLGSSGSLTAAIYSKFGLNQEVDINALRAQFSIIESYYHGTSSGFDPLISYFGKAIYLRKTALKVYPLNTFSLSNFFLVDSGIKRSEKNLITNTYEKLINQPKKLGERLVTLQNDAIQCLIGSEQGLDQHIRKISHFQLNFLRDLIPDNLSNFWKRGLQNDTFYLKLCGAGGGGYYLGYTNKRSNIEVLQVKYPIYWLEDYSSDLY